MKTAIYTAICGNRATLIDPPIIHPDVDYIAYVDKPNLNCKVWEQREAISFSLDKKYGPRRNAKIYKILPNLYLNEYDLTMWVDGNLFCKMHPIDIYNQFLLPNQSNIGVLRHAKRTCAYDEAKRVRRRRDYPPLIDAQMDYYKKENFPAKHGLYHLAAIIRKKSRETDLINLRWWEQICKFSSRDQLSFSMVLWSLGIKPTILPGLIRYPDANNFVSYYEQVILSQRKK